MTAVTPFDFVDTILQTKKNLLEEGATEKEYVPFVINRALSYHADTIYHANMMNLNYRLANRLQYAYLINIIKPRKRPFARWVKPISSDDLKAVQKCYGYNIDKAKEALKLLSDDELAMIKNKQKIGGVVK